MKILPAICARVCILVFTESERENKICFREIIISFFLSFFAPQNNGPTALMTRCENPCSRAGTHKQCGHHVSRIQPKNFCHYRTTAYFKNFLSQKKI